MMVQSDTYIDVENHINNNNNNNNNKEYKLVCYQYIKDIVNLVIPICLVFGLIALITYIICIFE